MKHVLQLVGLACTIFRTARAQVDQVGQAPFTSAPSSQPILTDDVRGKIGNILKTHRVVGYSLGIFRLDADEQEEYAQWGERTEAGAPVTKETIQGIASMSKAFTATAMGIVMDDFANGRNTTVLPQDISEFTWDTKIKDLIPEDWKLMDHWASEQVSIRDALSHVSGLPGHDLAYSHGERSLDVIRRMRYLRPSWEPRQKWEYNNQLYTVVQHLIERYSGLSLANFVNDRIFKPLNMTSSTYSPIWANATGHLSESRNPSGRRIPTWLFDEDLELAGAGGILSSAPDLLKWAKLWLDVTNSSEIGIPRRILDECLSAQVLRDQTKRSTYGFGWGQISYAGTELTLHSGGLPGVSTYLVLIPAHQIAIVQLASSDNKPTAELDILQLLMESIGIKLLPPGEASRLFNTEVSSIRELDSLAQKVTPQSSKSFPSPLLYAGKYQNPAYGDVVVCPLPGSPLDEECRKVYSDFASVGATPVPSMFGYFQRRPVWANYISFTPVGSSGDFVVNLTTIFPNGYGLNATPFAASGDYWSIRGAWQYDSAKFVKGFGFYDERGYESERHGRGKTVEERAQSWFVRV